MKRNKIVPFKLNLLTLGVSSLLLCASVNANNLLLEKKRYIVTLKSDSASLALPTTQQSNMNTLAASVGSTVIKSLESINAMSIELTPIQFKALKSKSNVAYIEEDNKRYISAESSPYGIAMVQANQLSDSSTGNQKVCIMDTGYSLNHPDLPNSGITGHSQPTTGNWYNDGNGHGTHVAGTIAAIGGNNQGVVGINPSGQLRLHIVKVFNNQGKWTYSSSIIEAVEECKSAGANIINMSLGGPTFSNAESNAFDSAYNSGILSVAAAGNGGDSSLFYPASYDTVMSVASVNRSKNIASSSQYNSQVEIAAPGVAVLSTYKGDTYKSLSGTSMATPHVSGAAALVWSYFPECTNAEIRHSLNATAEDRGTAGRDAHYGFGIAQAKAAHEYLANNRCADYTPPSLSFSAYKVSQQCVIDKFSKAPCGNHFTYGWSSKDVTTCSITANLYSNEVKISSKQYTTLSGSVQTMLYHNGVVLDFVTVSGSCSHADGTVSGSAQAGSGVPTS
jgi:serine protease